MNDLLRAAMLGTRQHGGPLPQSGTEIDPLIAQLALERDRERALLLSAGGADFLRRAGATALALPEDVALVAAPAESQRRASPRLGALLTTLFRDNSSELLREALELMAAAKLRLPEELLPLALGERDLEVRRALRPVLGERGRFLAELAARPDWAWARATESAPGVLPEDAERRWEEGDLLEREWLFALGRSVAPERARAWLATTFKSDRPEQRKRWLEALERRLMPEDATLLEAALDDRSSLVRLTAARILWRLPESSPARAIRAIARRYVTLQPLRAELPPESFAPALEKLGIVETPPRGVGARQFWLAQLVSACPPDELRSSSPDAPAQILARVQRHELADALLEGLTSAALRFEARAWFAPLWDQWSRREEQTPLLEREPVKQLSLRLDAPVLEQRLVTCLREQRRLELLELLPRPWPTALAQAFLRPARGRPFWLAPVLSLAARRLPLSLIHDFTLPAPSSEEPRYLAAAFDEFALLLDFRRRLVEETKQ